MHNPKHACAQHRLFLNVHLSLVMATSLFSDDQTSRIPYIYSIILCVCVTSNLVKATRKTSQIKITVDFMHDRE
jgi:hypothetical protein